MSNLDPSEIGEIVFGFSSVMDLKKVLVHRLTSLYI